MQIIALRENEGLEIGEDIHVTVREVCEDHVRLGISSPHHVPSYWEQTIYLDREGSYREQLQLQ